MKPDMVIYNNDRVAAVDMHIINDQYDLELAHRNKISKYVCLAGQLGDLRPRGFQCSTLTINWRGVLAVSSYKKLTGFRIIRKEDVKNLVSQAMIGRSVLPTDCSSV